MDRRVTLPAIPTTKRKSNKKVSLFLLLFSQNNNNKIKNKKVKGASYVFTKDLQIKSKREHKRSFVLKKFTHYSGQILAYLTKTSTDTRASVTLAIFLFTYFIICPSNFINLVINYILILKQVQILQSSIQMPQLPTPFTIRNHFPSNLGSCVDSAHFWVSKFPTSSCNCSIFLRPNKKKNKKKKKMTRL